MHATPSQLAVPGQSSGRSHELLHPFSYSHPNTSKASDISIGVQSTSTTAQSSPWDHQELTHQQRPEGRSTARATARGINRVASKAPSITSCATSRSRSRAPSVRARSRAPSPTPLRSHIELPNTFPIAPSPTQNTLAIPTTDTVPPTPESLPPIPTSLLNEETLWPILTIPRYDDCPTIPNERAYWSLRPVTLTFPNAKVPDDWISCTHPEGRLYFYHPEKRIYTDADVREHKIRAILAAFEARLHGMIREQSLELPPNYELVMYLESRPVSGGYNWLYYYVDRKTRSLFWLNEYDIFTILDPDLPCIRTLSDIKYGIEAQYWTHCEMYPYNHEMSDEVFLELSGILTFASTDMVTSMTSTVTYRSDDVHRMLGLVKSAKGMYNPCYTGHHLSRLMGLFAHQRYLNRYGQTYARLGRTQSVLDTKKHPKTPLITLLSPLFWNAPEVHLRALEKIWIDGIITIEPWSGFIGKLQNEWQEFVLYSTVLLNANVAFLAIPSVGDGSKQLSAAQISSNLSIVTSVGSILLGLLLVRQHRVKSRDTAHDAWRYLSSRKHPTLGLETLAIIYSLPYALLMWAMVTFLLAFSFECFGTPDRVGVFFFGAVWIAIAILVGWCIFTGWESSETTLMSTLRAWRMRLFREKDGDGDNDTSSGEGSSDVQSLEEKLVARRWMTRIFKHGVFPHSNDRPITEMQERASSTV
ncbi:hypothetical protein BC628DRAFT_1326187 [Trametes gibbosa]|nr:hypothetical protein BC628DRAFT_1326187 [Trametes gibbosa]